MGYDRIRYFEGVDGESTLISADNCSARTVYGHKFMAFARGIGFTGTRQVVDVQVVATRPHLQDAVNDGGYKVAEFPASARRIWYESPLADTAVELRPPVDDATLNTLNAFLVTMCEPGDAGLILDNRGPVERTLDRY